MRSMERAMTGYVSEIEVIERLPPRGAVSVS